MCNVKRKCISCGNDKLDILIKFDNFPESAQNIPSKEELDNEKGISIRLCQCQGCGLVQFDCGAVSYYKDVIRAGGYTTTMTELRKKQYRGLIEKYNLQRKKFLEVGCGQGEFLNVLNDFDVEAYGIEHKEDLVAKAQEKGLQVWSDFAENAETPLRDPYHNGKYDVFLSFNFLEHQPNPKAMLECIYENLNEDGMGLVTVPSFEYILDLNVYYEFIHDHLAYYTFETLEYLLNSCGFEVLEKEMINRDTLSCIVKKIPRDKVKHMVIGGEQILIDGIKGNIVDLGNEVRALLTEAEQRNEKLAVWGASHQGFTLASTTMLKDKARYIIDSAPFKQGKYAPASHLPIVSAEYFFVEPVERILIVAPGYTDEIAGIIRERFGTHVKIYALKSRHIEKYI